MHLLQPIKITRENFIRENLNRNEPVLISAAGKGTPWSVDKLWIEKGELNVERITRNFGDCLVSVHRCPITNTDDTMKIPKEFPEPVEMRVRDFFDQHWQIPHVHQSTQRAKFHQIIHDYSEKSKCYNLHELLSIVHGNFLESEQEGWYLKDWHMTRDQRQNACSKQNVCEHLYEVPEFFMDDWLNRYWDKEHPGRDDYRFVYIGTAGSWTRFHADVFRSYSWSSNISGYKIWFMIPPDQLDMLRDRHGNLPGDLLSASSQEYPRMYQCRPIFVFQMPGETIFVPSGWFHQVHNLGPTVSINHNWLNAFNLVYCTKFLLSELENTRSSLLDLLEDSRLGMTRLEWERECQLLLKAHAGMDIGMWLTMINNAMADNSNIPLYQSTHLDHQQTAQQFVETQINDALSLIFSDPHLRQIYES